MCPADGRPGGLGVGRPWLVRGGVGLGLLLLSVAVADQLNGGPQGAGLGGLALA
ncbi:MAG TPA: hypothetical protein VF933_26120 [Streptosporangiaceae bacterium]